MAAHLNTGSLVAVRYEDAPASLPPVEVATIRPGSRSKAPNLTVPSAHASRTSLPLPSPIWRSKSKEDQAAATKEKVLKMAASPPKHSIDHGRKSFRMRRNSQSLPMIKIDGAGYESSSSKWATKSKGVKPVASDSALPKITLDIPISSEPFLDLTMADMSFSKRGSVFLGGHKAIPSPKRTPEPRIRSTRIIPEIIPRAISADDEALSKQVRELYKCGENESQSSRYSKATSAGSVRTQDGEPPGSSFTTTGGSTLEDNRRSAYELAGGFEDWEDLAGFQVDRYGFIVTPQSPRSRVSTSHSLERSTSQSGKNGFASKLSMNGNNSASRLSRKLSRRSLKSSKSGKSAHSSADKPPMPALSLKNRPRGKARRTIAGAGDMLTLPPEGGSSSQGMPFGTPQTPAKSDAWTKKEAVRANKWRKMAIPIRSPSGPNLGGGMTFRFDTSSPHLQKRVFKGIPDIWRASAWSSFLESSRQKHPHLSPLTDAQLRALYADYASKPSPDDTQIDLDVPRTISSHVLFRRRYRGGQRLLFRVLHGLSLFFPQLGYVQGMASLASTLLCYYSEEESFITLVRLFQLRGVAKLYEPGFEGLLSTISDFETLYLSATSDLGTCLKDMGIDGTSYATRWFLTIFSLSLPFAALVRVWDVWMLLGEPVLASFSTTAPVLTTLAPSTATILPDRSGRGQKRIRSETVPNAERERGFEVLFAVALALVDALADTIRKGDFEAGMKGLTGFLPVGEEDVLMGVVEAEWKRIRK